MGRIAVLLALVVTWGLAGTGAAHAGARADRAPDTRRAWGCDYRITKPKLDADFDQVVNVIAIGKAGNCDRTREYVRFEVQFVQVTKSGRFKVVSSTDFAPVTDNRLSELAFMGECQEGWAKVPKRLFARAKIKRKGARKTVVVASSNWRMPERFRTCALN